jgi:hypothetical protein
MVGDVFLLDLGEEILAAVLDFLVLVVAGRVEGADHSVFTGQHVALQQRGGAAHVVDLRAQGAQRPFGGGAHRQCGHRVLQVDRAEPLILRHTAARNRVGSLGTL